MNEQKNLYLAIGISIAIIIFFQILLPTQPIQPPPIEEVERLVLISYQDSDKEKVIEEFSLKNI